MLHAYSLTIDIPGEKEGKVTKTFIADIPKDMETVLKKLLLI